MKKLILLIALFSVSAFADIAQNTWTLTADELDNAGTAQQLSSAAGELWVQSITIQALPGNSGNVFVANSSTNASGSARITLQAGESLVLEGRLLSNGDRAKLKVQDLYWDGATVGDDIVWSYIQ